MGACETDLKRLLFRCEKQVAAATCNASRLHTYLDAAESFLADLESQRRVDVAQGATAVSPWHFSVSGAVAARVAVRGDGDAGTGIADDDEEEWAGRMRGYKAKIGYLRDATSQRAAGEDVGATGHTMGTANKDDDDDIRIRSDQRSMPAGKDGSKGHGWSATAGGTAAASEPTVVDIRESRAAVSERLEAIRKRDQAQRAELLGLMDSTAELRRRRGDGSGGSGDKDGGVGTAGRKMGPGGTAGSGGAIAEADRELENEQATHEAETDELVKMTKLLKKHYQAAHEAIKRDNEALDAVDRAAEQNHSQLNKENRRLFDQVSKATNTSAFMWSALILTAVLFVATYIVIKLFPVRRLNA